MSENGATIPEVEINYCIKNKEGKVLLQQTCLRQEVVDLEWIPVYFEEPLVVGADTELLIEFTIRMKDNNKIAVFCTEKDNYKDGELFIQNEQKGGMDLEFEVLAS